MPIFEQPHTIEALDMEFVWIEAIQSWVSRYEVSNAQYTKFKPGHNVKRVNNRHSLLMPEQPVVNVSYGDALAFIEWMSEDESENGRIPSGWEFKLPTGDQWEAFATCGKSRRHYPWGKEWPPPHGNVGDSMSAMKNGFSDYTDKEPVSCDVREAGSNEWGLVGISGNVAEWVDEWYGQSKRKRVFRGGSWRTMSKNSLKTQDRKSVV